MEDGSHVTIKIEYKPNSKISGNEKFGSYYYIVQYFDTKPSPPETREQQGKAKTDIEEYDKIFSDVAREQQGKAKTPRIEISFYDRKGYSLFNNGWASTLAPGWNHVEDEENRIDGGWEWKGRFDESYITVENFRDIHSIKVTSGSR